MLSSQRKYQAETFQQQYSVISGSAQGPRRGPRPRGTRKKKGGRLDEGQNRGFV